MTSPSTPPFPLYFRLFPATDRPSQPLHDIRMEPSDIETLGCGAYGHVVLRPVEDELGLDFPARVVPCRRVQAGHVLMAEAAAAVFNRKQIGSLVEVHMAGDEDGGGQGCSQTLYITPLLRGEQQQQLEEGPSQRHLERVVHPLMMVASSKCLIFVKFLSLTLAYRVMKIERAEARSHTSSTKQSNPSNTTVTVVLTARREETEELKEDKEELQSRSTSFGAIVCEEILEVFRQSKTRDDAFRMQGVLLSAPRGAGKTMFLQQLQRQLSTMATTVYVRGKHVVEALMAAEGISGPKSKNEGGREGGDEAGDDYLRQRLGLSFSEDGKESVVVLVDDFDAILSGEDEGGMEEEGAATQEEIEEELQLGGRETTRALKTLQRLLKGPAAAGATSRLPVLWVLAARESMSESGGGGGGASLQRRLAQQHGRLFDKVVKLPRPRVEDRASILRHTLELTAPNLLPKGNSEKVEEGKKVEELLRRVAEMTDGFLPGDLVTLCRVAALHAFAGTTIATVETTAIDRGEGEMERNATSFLLSSYSRSLSAFIAARREVSPAVLSGLADRENNNIGGTIRNNKKLCWASVGGYEDVKNRLRKLVEWPILYSETFARLGLRGPQPSSSSTRLSSTLPSGGILLYGPSGCGKSLLARVLAEEVKANFVELPATEVFSPFLGDSEARVRKAFARARQAAPCILFLDELDAMAAKRGVGGKGGGVGVGSGGVYARVLSTLLNEMDGVSGQAEGLLILAATNRREAVDAALLRPGRLQELLLVPYPRPELDYLPILQVATRHMPLHIDVDLAGLVTNVLKPLMDEGETKIMTPANLMALCREAGLACLRETEGEGEVGKEVDKADLVVRQEHFVQAAVKLL